MRYYNSSSEKSEMAWKTFICLVCLVAFTVCEAMNDEEKLTEYLLKKGNYNRLLRPSDQVGKRVIVHFDLLLSQLIGVNEREQFMVTKVWLPQRWEDARLLWDPKMYGNITKLQLPSSKIWLPDIVLYNNADGEYEASLQSNAIVLYNGSVSWMPPAIYRSACSIKVSNFPFDEQNCTMTFRSWTYTRKDIDLHLTNNVATLDDFTPSGEWDILDTPGSKSEHIHGEPHEEITYSLIIKRKPLFYTVNLIIPCILITFLAILVFYTPSDCGEKMTLCISVLLALTVFLLLLSKMVPPTSLDVPLIGKYLMFTMVLVTLSIVTSVCVLNVHHRQASTHEMPQWLRSCFLEILPPLLWMNRPPVEEGKQYAQKLGCLASWIRILTLYSRKPTELNGSTRKRYFVSKDGDDINEETRFGINLGEVSGSRYVRREKASEQSTMSHELQTAIKSVEFITEHLKSRDVAQSVSEDWRYIAMVIDRAFFILFIIVFVAGTIGIFLQPFV
uniref:neuronal acetylcholine receptor subunit beta-4-like isoform X1 n=2 Tax=Styela clava TaxID=7725 RepID=UPI00193A9D2A|nr:neuronal acetylcholine receptor subunit beta-4-like isoform X1 [Styela clava]